jgi:hypothetical protein
MSRDRTMGVHDRWDCRTQVPGSPGFAFTQLASSGIHLLEVVLAIDAIVRFCHLCSTALCFGRPPS